MGYFCRFLPTDEKFKIKKENFDKAYRLACELNGLETGAKRKTLWCLKHDKCHDALEKPADSKSKGDPSSSFKWVSWNYDELCKDIFDVFREFEIKAETDENGDICNLKFEEKEGDESALLVAIAPCVEESSMLHVLGQDDALWAYWFNERFPLGCEIMACNDLATTRALAGRYLTSNSEEFCEKLQNAIKE